MFGIDLDNDKAGSKTAVWFSVPGLPRWSWQQRRGPHAKPTGGPTPPGPHEEIETRRRRSSKPYFEGGKLWFPNFYLDSHHFLGKHKYIERISRVSVTPINFTC